MKRLETLLETENGDRLSALKSIADANETQEVDGVLIEPLLAKAILKVHSQVDDSIKNNIVSGDIATVADTCWLLTKGM